MATLPNITPTRGSRKTVEPRILRLQYGDGYSQRTADGINTNDEIWDVEWDGISFTDADTLEAFFIALDGDNFDWTPPNESVAKTFSLKSFSRTFAYEDKDIIMAQFIREYDL